MIVMLGYLELEIEILDVGMKTAESNNCRKVSRNNRDANGVLAATLEETRLFYKDEWKFIDLFTQSISGLY